MSLWEMYKAKRLGYADDLWTSLIGHRLGGYSWQSDYETTPYIYRAMPNLSHYYNREIMEEVVGGSVAFNQLAKELATGNWIVETGVTVSYSNGVATIANTSTSNNGIYCVCDLTVGHKYFLSCELSPSQTGSYTVGRGSSSVYIAKTLSANSGYTTVATIGNSANSGSTPMFIYGNGSYSDLKARNYILTDLTLALGSTIADYVYSLEQATAGSGVAWLKEHFPKMCQYNPYDAGSIQSVSGLASHDTVGFNQWDEEWEVGIINASTGENEANNSVIRSKGYIKAFPSTEYYVSAPESAVVLFYDADKGFIDSTTRTNQTFTTPKNTAYIRFRMSYAYGTTYNHDICINLSDASRNGQYEPYRKSSYPLDSTLTLRGIPKLDNGKLYYDGDVYKSDGTVNRKYGIVDLGTLNWGKDATTGTHYRFTSTGLSDIAKGVGVSAVANLVCSNYVAESANDTYSHLVGIALAGASGGYLYVCDETYDDENAFKTAMSGVYLVYEKNEVSTETASPFTKTQLCDSGGTEEFVTSGIVSVGHKSKYAEK